MDLWGWVRSCRSTSPVRGGGREEEEGVSMDTAMATSSAVLLLPPTYGGITHASTSLMNTNGGGIMGK